MVMGIPGINLPNLTMLPESIRPIKHQTYKDRLDESLGMRRGPERNFRQSMADRRDESIGASLGRYGEPGLPSLAPRKTIPRATKGQFLPKPHKLPRPITAPVMPTTPKTIEEIIAQIVETEPGTDTVGPPGTTISPIQEAVDAAVGGGIDDYSDLPPGVEPGGRYFTDPITGNPMYQPPMPEGRPGFAQPMVMPPAIDLTTGQPKPLPNFDFNQPPPQPDPVQEAVDATVGPIGGETEPGLVGGVDFMPGYRTDPWTPPILPEEITPPPVVTDPVQEAVDAAVGGETPVADEVPFMDQLQAMVDQILAQQAEQQTAQQQAQQQQAQQAQNYTLSGSRIGYNPYTSGQYQADPYGAAGVPDMGGLTTIPVPQPLTGIGYANYQAPENMT